MRFRGEKVCCPLELSFVLYHHISLSQGCQWQKSHDKSTGLMSYGCEFDNPALSVITFAMLSGLPGLFLTPYFLLISYSLFLTPALSIITFAMLSGLPGLFLELLRCIHCEANWWPVFKANILMPPIACSSSVPSCCGCSSFLLSPSLVKLLVVLFG